MSIDRTSYYGSVQAELDQRTVQALNYRQWRGARLTPREREIIMLVGQGMTDQEIASRLCLSVRTVQNHLHRSYGKLRVNNRAAAAQIVMCKPLAQEREV